MITGDKFKTKLNFQTFGSNEKYFEEYIKDKDLTYQYLPEGLTFSYILDSNGVVWTISNKDI
jgi:hypothetical protein